MEGAAVGGRGEEQTDGLAAGGISLTRLGDRSAAKTTRKEEADLF